MKKKYEPPGFAEHERWSWWTCAFWIIVLILIILLYFSGITDGIDALV